MRCVDVDDFLVGNDGGLVVAGMGRPAVSDLISRFDRRPKQGLATVASYRLAAAMLKEEGIAAELPPAKELLADLTPVTVAATESNPALKPDGPMCRYRCQARQHAPASGYLREDRQ